VHLDDRALRERITVQLKYKSRNPVIAFLTSRFLRAIVRTAEEVSPRTVLDVGCGEGIVAHLLTRQFPQVGYFGCDIHEPSLRLAASACAGNAHFFSADALYLPVPDRSFDLTICSETLEHLKDYETALAELVRVSVGTVLVTVPHEPFWRIGNMLRGNYLRSFGNTPEHVNHWTKKGITRLLSSYFDTVDARSVFPWTFVLCQRSS